MFIITKETQEANFHLKKLDLKVYQLSLFSYLPTRSKKDKMVGCGARNCTNRADKDSNIITSVAI